MTERNSDAVEPVAGDEDPRKQLWVRAGVAGGLIAALLGGLAVFDYVSRPPVPAEAPLPTRPIAPAQVTPEEGRDAPPDVLRAGSDTAATDAAPPQEESAPPMLPGGGVASESEAPSRAMRSGRIGEGSKGTAQPHAGAVVPHAPTAQAPTPAGAPAAHVPPPAVTAAAPVAAPASAAPRPPVAQEASRPAPAAAVVSQAPRPAVSATAPASAVPPRQAVPAAGVAAAQPAQQVASPARGERPYVLEFGVFSSVASAEALRARLAQAGIPSQLETRVVVGPFADRKEALAAQARLREKGIDPGTLLPLGR